jgi:O-acetyl-ADP-ribose deacetylase (regulator of RNase III)
MAARGSSVIPELVRQWKARARDRAVEVWRTRDIVSSPPGTNQVRRRGVALINPANEGLTGCANFPYFPKGGPVPPGATHNGKLRYATSWGGMDAGPGMLYPSQTVDGTVHTLGGEDLARACMRVKEVSPGVRCPIGNAVCTPPGGRRLCELYKAVVHTVPPFYQQYSKEDAEELLLSAYRNAFAQAWLHHTDTAPTGGWRWAWGWVGSEKRGAEKPGNVRACATPLLGAGARGAPIEAAVRVAVIAAAEWIRGSAISTSCHDVDAENVLIFGIVDAEIADTLETALDQTLQCLHQEEEEI